MCSQVCISQKATDPGGALHSPSAPLVNARFQSVNPESAGLHRFYVSVSPLSKEPQSHGRGMNVKTEERESQASAVISGVSFCGCV